MQARQHTKAKSINIGRFQELSDLIVALAMRFSNDVQAHVGGEIGASGIRHPFTLCAP
jgi:hypothetical protein